jgi:CRP/FNR family cyclic AMP-dependent transcriptional regulator
MATVVTMTECVIMRIEMAVIERALRDEPSFSEKFMAYILSLEDQLAQIEI